MLTGAVQPSFTGGEWSPSLYARVDLQKYPTALRLCENFIIHPHGGVSNRAGTEFIIEVKDSTNTVRLIPFEFSVEQAYVLEFGDQYIRVIKDGGQIDEPAGSGTDIVEAATYKWTASGSGTNEYYCEALAGGDPSISEPKGVYEDVGGADTDMPTGILGSLAAGEWNYGDNDSLGYSTVYVRLSDNVDPDTKADGYLEASYPVEIVSPYLHGDLAQLKYTQSADVLYITHPDYAPRKLSRTSHYAWTLTTISFAAGVATPTNFASGTGGTNTYKLTAVDADGLESGPTAAVTGSDTTTLSWTTQSVAKFNVYKAEADGIYGWIKSVDGSKTSWTASDIDPDYTKGIPIVKDPFDALSDYPGVATFFEQRLLYARTDNKPQTLWGSVTGDFENQNISDPLRDDDAYNFTINALQVNEIVWMVPLNNELIIGTTGAEWKLSSGSQSDAVTPTNVKMSMQSRWGSHNALPQLIGNSIIFVGKGGSIIRDLQYNLEQDGYTGNNLTILASHLLKDRSISEWAYQQVPDPLVWCVRDDGKMLTLTYAKEHDVWGWARHTTDGNFKSVCSVPNASGKDEVYVVVERTIGGTAKKYIEYFKDRLTDDDIEQAWFVDSGLRLNAPITITGATQADPVVITATAHGFSDGDLVDIRDVAGMTELNGNRYTVANADTNTFELQTWSPTPVDVDGSAFTAYTSGGTVREAVTTVSGLSHLEGETVSILADGSVLPQQTVSSGAITLPSAASIVTIGLPFTSNLETMEIELAVEAGTLQDKKRQIKSVTVRFEKARAFWAGPSSDRLVELQFRQYENYDSAIDLYTGDREMFVHSGEVDQGRVYIRNVDPVPLTVLALMPKVEYGPS